MKKTFCIGAVGYGLIEILWRGHTHPSMLLAGGTCLCGIRRLCRKPYPVPALCCHSAALITAVELSFGIVMNLLLGKNVWDYQNHKGNLWGQICPLYSFLWLALSVPIVIFYRNRDCKKSADRKKEI